VSTGVKLLAVVAATYGVLFGLMWLLGELKP
jgi:hypothetical protein